MEILNPSTDWKLKPNVECKIILNKLKIKTPENGTVEFCRSLTNRSFTKEPTGSPTRDMCFNVEFVLDVLLNEIQGKCDEKCERCEEYVQQLRHHIIQAHCGHSNPSPHTQTVTVFKCDSCSSIYSSPSMLVNHRNTHSGNLDTLTTAQYEDHPHHPILPNISEWNTLKHESSQSDSEVKISHDEEQLRAMTTFNPNPLAVLKDMNHFLIIAKNLKEESEYVDVEYQDDLKDPLLLQDFELDLQDPSSVKYEGVEISTEYDHHRVAGARDPKNDSNDTDTHSLENQLKYGIYGKDFLVSSDLIIKHKLTHTQSHSSGRKSHRCDRCRKYFRTLQDLTRHKLTHNTREKSHECNVCGKCFAKRRYLTQHEIVHSGNRPHKCDLCGSCFAYKCVLIRHTLIHTGEKPHKCGVCGESFNGWYELTRHKLKHACLRTTPTFVNHLIEERESEEEGCQEDPLLNL